MPPNRSAPSYPITAYAAANGLGLSKAEILAALRSGRSALTPCHLELPFETTCGTLPDDLPPPPRSLSAYDSRLCRMALLTLEEMQEAIARAVRRYGASRVAVLVGTSTGGIRETETAHARFVRQGSLPPGFDFERQHMFHALAELVSAATKADGPAFTVSTACSSSGKVFGSAQRLLSADLADAVLVGGVDTLCQTTLRGFGALQALSRTPCRPFAARRDGISLGEGAAFALLERHGEGPVRLLGVGESNDAYHMSHPHPEGLGARLAMEGALRQAGLEPAAVDYVNAHGTGTPANDVIEATAISAVLGDRVMVSSTKGYTGHTLGAAGATEAIIAALSIEHGFVPKSLNAEPLDPAVTASICLEPLFRPVRTVLTNSFAFGGSNVSLVLGAG